MFDFQISAVAFHPHEHAVAMGSVQPNSKVLLTSREFINDAIYEFSISKVGVYIYDRSKDKNASDISPQLISNDSKANQKCPGAPLLYPQSQVTKLIMDTAAADEEDVRDRRTPVDLQDIVEKLNNAISDAKSNLNTMEGDLSPVHNKSSD